MKWKEHTEIQTLYYITSLKVEVVVQVVKTCESPWSPLLPEKKKMIRAGMAIRVVKLSKGRTQLERFFA